MKRKLVTVATLLMLATTSSAQSKFSMHFDLAPASGEFKVGEFDDFSSTGSVSVDELNGFAGIGFGIGFEAHVPIGTKGINALFGIDGYRHTIKSGLRTLTTSNLDENERINYSEYYNIPLSAGLHYEYSLGEQASIFGQVTGILNFFKISKGEYIELEKTSMPWEETITTRYDMARSIGLGFKAGAVFKQKYILSIGLKKLGSHTIGVSRTEDFKPTVPELSAYTETSNYTDVKSVSMLNISFGIQF